MDVALKTRGINYLNIETWLLFAPPPIKISGYSLELSPEVLNLFQSLCLWRLSLVHAPHLISKSNTKNKTAIYLSLSCLMHVKYATVFWKLVVEFEALTTHIANPLHIPVCSEILSCPLYFDYGVYSEMILK